MIGPLSILGNDNRGATVTDGTPPDGIDVPRWWC